MSNYNSLKTTIDANIKQNGRQEITGQILNSVLNQMVTTLGAGYQFMGVATPTNPGTAQTPDYKCFYHAATPGTYTNLGSLVVNEKEMALLAYSSQWYKMTTSIVYEKDYDITSTSRSVWSPSVGDWYLVRNTSENARNIQIYLHKNSGEDVHVGTISKGQTIAFQIPNEVQYINFYSGVAGFSFHITNGFGTLIEIEKVKMSIDDIDTQVDVLSSKIDDFGTLNKIAYSIAATSQSIWSISEGTICTIENTSTSKIIRVYLHTTDGKDILMGSCADNEVVTFKMPSGVQYINVYCASGNFSFNFIRSTGLISLAYMDTFKVREIEKYWRILPQRNILILGDSFSIWGNRWFQYMAEKLKASVKTLAVSSASLKDKYQDRETYPYTSRPSEADNSGNLNTLSCQVEKLKRLMEGTDLDPGETQWYSNPEDYPNIIIIEGGLNDSYDEPSVEETYYSQMETLVENVKIKRTSTSPIETGNCGIKTPIENVNRTCFAGAYRYLIESLSDIFPNAQIFIVTTPNLGYRTTTPTEIRCRQAEQQRKCGCIFSVPVIDWNRNCQINTIDNYPPGDGTTDNPYLYGEGTGLSDSDSDDLLHPNERGGKKLGRVAANAIIEHYKIIGD